VEESFLVFTFQPFLVSSADAVPWHSGGGSQGERKSEKMRKGGEEERVD